MAIFNGAEGELIDTDQAATWTANYRAAEGENATKASFYGREILQKLLDQDGCIGIRIYYAIDERGQKQMVLVGADVDGNDLVEMIVDSGVVCPPYCTGTGNLAR
jgi:hypothetical protein